MLPGPGPVMMIMRAGPSHCQPEANLNHAGPAGGPRLPRSQWAHAATGPGPGCVTVGTAGHRHGGGGAPAGTVAGAGADGTTVHRDRNRHSVTGGGRGRGLSDCQGRALRHPAWHGHSGWHGSDSVLLRLARCGRQRRPGRLSVPTCLEVRRAESSELRRRPRPPGVRRGAMRVGVRVG